MITAVIMAVALRRLLATRNRNCTGSHLTNSDLFSHLAGASSLGIRQTQGCEEFGVLMTSSLTPGFFCLCSTILGLSAGLPQGHKMA